MSTNSSRPPQITARDRAIIGSTARLGAVSTRTLHALHAPDADPSTIRRRLIRLRTAGLLDRVHANNVRGLHLYCPGLGALAPGQERPWRPPPGQLDHTLAVGDVLIALLRPDPGPALPVDGWRGEGEIRAWETPGHPRPDLRVHLADLPLWLEVEVDRGTEGGPAWHRKLTRYRTHRSAATVLAVTTSSARARNLAVAARDAGVSLLGTTYIELGLGAEAQVWTGRASRTFVTALAERSTTNTGG